MAERRQRATMGDELERLKKENAELKAEVARLREGSAASDALLQMVGNTVVELRKKLQATIGG